MVNIEEDGSLLFVIALPKAHSVEVVGTFDGWHDQHFPLTRRDDGSWTGSFDPGPGEYLFRYLVDQERWMLDEQSSATDHDPEWGKSKICRPLIHQTPDSLAA